MKKIYIILMHTHTVPAKIIKAVTKYEYSHVCISLEKHCNILYSFGRRNVHSILNAGFCIEHKNGEFFKTFNKTQCKIYEIEITEEQYKKVKEILQYMQLHSKLYKYDYFGIIPRFFGIPITLKNRYVCSYFVAYILAKAKIYYFNKKICMIKPQDLAKLKGANEIYQGSYMLYQEKTYYKEKISV